jgi:hypothetical protein
VSREPSLNPSTVDRVLQLWRAWAATPGVVGDVSVVAIGEERLVYAPEHLRDRLDGVLVDSDALGDALGDELIEIVGEARLAFGDAQTLRLEDTTDVIPITNDDPRLRTLRGRADPVEWAEATNAELGVPRFAILDDDAIAATSTVQLWGNAVGRLGVFTAAHARRRGLAGRVGSAAAAHSLGQNCIPMWRSRVTNTSSARVADRLGFVALGRQVFARVRQHRGAQ